MKQRTANQLVIGLVGLGIIGSTALQCRAGFLHRSYQGSMEAHGHRYVVNNNGTIDIQRKDCENRCYVACDSITEANCRINSPSWQTYIEFDSVEQLHDVIGDLQQVEKALNDADKGDR